MRRALRNRQPQRPTRDRCGSAGCSPHGLPQDKWLNRVGGPGTVRSMKRFVAAGGFVAALLAVLAAPVSAHGDHDARPLARQLDAGPFTLSLWQVYPDAGDAMTPHLIVMFDGGTAPAEGGVSVDVNAAPVAVQPSTTTSNAWETTQGVAEGDVVTVTVSDGQQTWALDPVVVPPPTTSMLPMQELIYVSIFLTLGTAWWVIGRTARAWRRPAVTVA